jgi:micrococcal nuclease
MKKIMLLFFLLCTACTKIESLEGPYIVGYVVDGDTLDVNFGRIRLSGINTPETGECYYEEAKEKLQELTLFQEVRLEEDETNKDKYGRYLRYVYTNTTFVNAYLVQQGYARVFDKYNATTKYYVQLKELEKIAQEQKKGLWSCTDPFENCLYVASKNSKVYHSPDCKWAKRIKPENRICIQSEQELVNYTAPKSC